MQNKRSIFLVVLLVPFLLFMSFAEESHGSQTKDFLGKLVNFLLLFGGLAYLLRKPLGKFLQERSDSLGQTIKEARQSQEESSARLKKVEERLSKLGEEIHAVQKEAEAAGRSIRQDILEEAKKATDRLKHFSSQEIEMLTQSAVREIKEYAADLAADLAKKNIQERLTEEYHASVIDKSIERLDQLHEKSNPDKTIRSRTH